MKRIVSIQDISCVGKCSLTVALPIISALGVETAIIPTALLSTHTAFKNFTFLDLTDEMLKIVKHWQQENLNFDAIYTGYLGSLRQIEVIKIIIDLLNTKVIIDPVMADNGNFYHGFDEKFAEEMLKLCLKADVIVPNLTEACFMLKKPYISKGYSKDYIKEILKTFYNKGIKVPVVTGVSFNEETLGVMAYISEKDLFFEYYNQKINMHLHGTGDIFASVFSGYYILGNSIEDSLKLAVDFVCECMKNSQTECIFYGANFEKTLPYLIKRL